MVARAIAEGLAASWVGPSQTGAVGAALRDRAGAVYAALVSDEETAVAINTNALADAGLSLAVTRTRQWSVTSGDFGRFEHLLWLLTLDRAGGHGNNGYTNHRYNYSHIVRYGLAMGTDYTNGLNTWATAAGLSGRSITDRNPWPAVVHLSNPRVGAGLRLMRRFIVRGYVPSVKESLRESPLRRFRRGGAALALVQASNLLALSRTTGFRVSFAPLPFRGAPVALGKAVMVSSSAQDAAEAFAVARALPSKRCQARLAELGIALPAAGALRDTWLRGLERRGLNASIRVFASQHAVGLPLITGSPDADRIIGDAATRVVAGAGPQTLRDAERIVAGILRK
jgi:hypothetical protein